MLKVDDGRIANNVIADKVCCRIKGLSESKEVTALGRTSGRIRGRVGGVKAHVKGFQGFPDKIFALNTVIGLNGDTFLRPGDSGVWCRGTEHEEETIVGMIFAEQRGDENIQHMCFVHDMDIYCCREYRISGD